MTEDLVPAKRGARAPAELGPVRRMLDTIRPEWKSRALIQRVERLLPVDPSSACQRLFNASISDLREKIIVAGLDVAGEAAKRAKLPAVSKDEEILDSYSTSNVINLAYEMGILSRPEWKKLRRVYSIRRDLEHEDDEYEAGFEDLVYVFKVCIEAVLSRDPIQALKVTDVKQIIERSDRFVPSAELFQDYDRAPAVRQSEIGKFLVSICLDGRQPDIVRMNAYDMLGHLRPLTKDPVKIDFAKDIQTRIGRGQLDLRHAKIACACGALPYLKQAQLVDFWEKHYGQMKSVGHTWTEHAQHGDLLGSIEDVGGLRLYPVNIRKRVLRWLVLCYLGEPGGYGMGRNRPVFYSNVAAPIIERLISEAKNEIAEELRSLCDDGAVKGAIKGNKYIARRLEALIDLVE